MRPDDLDAQFLVADLDLQRFNRWLGEDLAIAGRAGSRCAFLPPMAGSGPAELSTGNQFGRPGMF